MTTVIFSNQTGLYNNGKVGISKDLIFGLSVYTESGWTPLSQTNGVAILLVIKLVDNDPLFLWKDQLNSELQKIREVEQPPVVPYSDKQLYQKDGVFDINVDARQYLKIRETDFNKLKENVVFKEDGIIEFSNSQGYVYCTAKATTQKHSCHYLLKMNNGVDRKVYGELPELYAEILRRFW